MHKHVEPGDESLAHPPQKLSATGAGVAASDGACLRSAAATVSRGCLGLALFLRTGLDNGAIRSQPGRSLHGVDEACPVCRHF